MLIDKQLDEARKDIHSTEEIIRRTKPLEAVRDTYDTVNRFLLAVYNYSFQMPSEPKYVEEEKKEAGAIVCL